MRLYILFALLALAGCGGGSVDDNPSPAYIYDNCTQQLDKTVCEVKQS